MAGDSAPLSVPSAGVTLAVHRSGTRTGPTVVLSHGYPDDHHVWDRVMPLLDDHDVVTYDARGAGESSAPSARAGYRVERLVDDLVAVLDAVRPDGGAVHLVGHDWGSVQLWAAVFAAGDDPRLRGRIASFVSISGPDLRLYGAYLRTSAREHRWRRLAGQLAKSSYILAFQVPVIPELVVRAAPDRVRQALARSQGLEEDHWPDSFGTTAANGLNLYRANAFRSASSPLPEPTDIPVTLVIPVEDDFLSPSLYDGLSHYVRHLSRHEVSAGHWVPWTRPEAVASTVRETVSAAPGTN
ncbi:alpha/beta fold hydrolase [Mumia sp. zg.B21]|uniref:alpha/beta fold hydrolase n=1 Tax=Mumia sp. zg.B21 TaxID=2855447 RepID=UPI001C6F1176|nr:alpha/beta fold hydrolase [Mumia sp. zg.B21]MBW9209223.1 alpha/beta fold hydrolase [Mumia sp. zg.B21]